MGCVLGTEASHGRRRSAGDRRRRRRSTEGPPGAVDANVAVRVGKEATEQQQQGTRRAGDVPAVERRKPRLDPCLRNQQGWPPWLLAVAGEAIQGWTPRRANAFEKLAKVGHVCPNSKILKEIVFVSFGIRVFKIVSLCLCRLGKGLIAMYIKLGI